MILITIVNGIYKPTYNWGAPHCKNMTFLLVFRPTNFDPSPCAWEHPLGSFRSLMNLRPAERRLGMAPNPWSNGEVKMNTGTTSFIFRRYKKNRTGSCSIGGLMTHLFFQNQELLVFRSWERLQASVPPKIIRASVRMIAQEPHVQCHAALATWIHNAVPMWVSPTTQPPWYHFLYQEGPILSGS